MKITLEPTGDCPFEGGEKMCDEPACWRRCDVCEGNGGWKTLGTD